MDPLVPPLVLFIFLGSWVSYSCADEQLGTGWASTAEKCFVLSNRGPRLCLPRAGQTTLTSPVLAAKNNIYVPPKSYPSYVPCHATAHWRGFRNTCLFTLKISWAVLTPLWIQRKFSLDPRWMVLVSFCREDRQRWALSEILLQTFVLWEDHVITWVFLSHAVAICCLHRQDEPTWHPRYRGYSPVKLQAVNMVTRQLSFFMIGKIKSRRNTSPARLVSMPD